MSSFRSVALRLGTLSVVSGTLACHDLSGLAGSQQLPSGTPDPSVYRTAAGALALYQSTLAAFQYSYRVTTQNTGNRTDTTAGVFVNFVLSSGELTDELQPSQLQCSTCLNRGGDVVDARQLNEGNTSTENLYVELQSIRNGAAEGIGALAAYDSAASPALRGQLYALSGYAELLLADFYCSGIPLSTLNFTGDFTYAPGSTTAQVYHDALAKFTTAMTLSRDSARILNFARMGAGRAYLALGQFDSAAAAVASVPDGFAYQFLVNWTGRQYGQTNLLNDFQFTESNREGMTGLPYFNDPRTAAQFTGNYMPVKYGGVSPGILPITVADWIEATLIRAEAALHAGNTTTWLATLNRLRTNGTTTVSVFPDTIVDTLGYTGCTLTTPCDASGLPASGLGSLAPITSYTVNIPDPSPEIDNCRTDAINQYRPCITPQVNVYVDFTHTQTKTVWQAGTGGINGLAPLTDPGTDTARVSLLFQERAYWLFLTGHRQGDLRRLIRQYGRRQEQIYPIGPYPQLQLGAYGTDVNAPVPSDVESPNPLFHGCLARGA